MALGSTAPLTSTSCHFLQPPIPYQVLLVEDDDLQAEIVAHLLRQAGFCVEMLTEPVDFLTVYQRVQPDVTLLDMQMPQISGLELAQLLNTTYGIARSSIIFLSAERDPLVQLEALSIGAEDFVCKPPEPKELVARVGIRARTGRAIKQHLGQREQAYQALYQEQQRIREAIHHHALVSEADAQGRITYVNDQFCAVSGFREQQLLGQTDQLFVSGRHSKAFYAKKRQMLQAGLIWQGEVCQRRQDGQDYWVESTVVPFLDTQGRIEKYLSLQTDITDLKFTKQRLKQAEQAQRRLAWEYEERTKEVNCLAQITRYINTCVTQKEPCSDRLLSHLVTLIPQGWRYPEYTYVQLCWGNRCFTSSNFCLTQQQLYAERSVSSAENAPPQVLNLRVCLDLEHVSDLSHAQSYQPLDEPFLVEEIVLFEQILDQIALALGHWVYLNQ